MAKVNQRQRAIARGTANAERNPGPTTWRIVGNSRRIAEGSVAP
jgi:hypothetical protein